MESRQPHEARRVVVIGEGNGGAVAAAHIASGAIRREGYALLSGGTLTGPQQAGPGLDVTHQLARGTRGLVVSAAARPVHWQQVIETADQVVVTTTTADVASAVAKLQALHGWGGRAPELAAGAVVVLSRVDARHPAPSEVAHRFDLLARTTVVVPHDEQGITDPLQLAAPTPTARAAWDRVVHLVLEDEVDEDDMDTQPRIDVRDLFAGTTPPGVAPVGAAGSPAGRSSSLLSAMTGRRWAIVGVAAVLVLALAATAFVLGGVGRGGSGPTVASGEAPVDPVHGWTNQAEWISSPIASGDQTPNVLVREGAAVITTGDPAHPDLTALRASDGSQLWTSPIDGALTGPPQMIPWGDGTGVVAATSSTLYVWPDLGAEGSAPTPQTYSFTEADVTLVQGSPVPLLANEDTLTALVLHDGALRKRELPSNTTPVAADSDGRVLSIGSGAHWWSSGDDGEISDGKLLAPPAYKSLPGDVLGMAGTKLVVNWTNTKHTTLVVGYDVTNQMELRWHAVVTGRIRPDDFAVAPDGSWMVAGRDIISTSNGASTPLSEDWDTVRVAGDRAWSRDRVAMRDGRITDLPTPVADLDGVPFHITGSGLGLVLLQDGDGASRIYALRPDPDA